MDDELQVRMARRRLRPCSGCQGTRFFAGAVAFEHGAGSNRIWLDLVICAQCGLTQTFVNEDPRVWVRALSDYQWLTFDIGSSPAYRRAARVCIASPVTSTATVPEWPSVVGTSGSARCRRIRSVTCGLRVTAMGRNGRGTWDCR